ncbi:MAG: aspartate aminotransferase family protein [Candidatus Aminicenantes bacterium]|nr:aspartate aminotransferase family protein [Candidatus Aminicenantes bacterium]
MKDHSFLQRKYLVNSYVNRGLTLVAGDGVHLYDAAGTPYLDLMSNYGVNIFGYGHPALTARLEKQLRTLVTLHGSFTNDLRSETAQELVSRCGGGLAQAFFSSSGSEANEAALKFAVLATGRKRFIACRNGYHGKTLGALSATDGSKFRSAFEPLLWDFVFIPFNDLESLEAALQAETAAFLVEPIQGEGGIILPDPGYLAEAAELCRSRGALLVLDEVQTGLGRTGRFLASQSEHIAFDIVTVGKGLGGGIPAAATLVTQAIGDKIPRSAHTSTFGGNPLAAAGIRATLDLIDDPLLGYVRDVGAYFLERLRSIRSDLIVQVRGVGLMLGLVVSAMRDDILKGLQREKVLAIPAADDVVRFLPPFIIEKPHLDEATEKIEKVVSSLSRN